MIVLFFARIIGASFLTVWISMKLYLKMPAAWLCEAWETPEERHQPPYRCPRRKTVLTVCAALLAAFSILLHGREGGSEGLQEIVFLLAAAVILLPAVWSDLDFRIIPDQVCLAAFVTALLRGLTEAGASGVTAAIGGGMLAGALMLSSCLAGYLVSGKEGMGMGDVKLSAACGALTACTDPGLWWMRASAEFTVAVLTAAIWFSVLLICRRARYGDAEPLAPWIVLSVFLVIAAL